MPPRDGVDEGAPILPEEEPEAPAFAKVQLVAVQASHGGQDVAWHPELAAGQPCPRGCGYTLKRHRSTVYCGFCKQRWWSKRPLG
jgi:hypothetical protein